MKCDVTLSCFALVRYEEGGSGVLFELTDATLEERWRELAEGQKTVARQLILLVVTPH